MLSALEELYLRSRAANLNQIMYFVLCLLARRGRKTAYYFEVAHLGPCHAKRQTHENSVFTQRSSALTTPRRTQNASKLGERGHAHTERL